MCISSTWNLPSKLQICTNKDMIIVKTDNNNNEIEFKPKYLCFELIEKARNILPQFVTVIYHTHIPSFQQSGFNQSGSVALSSVGDSWYYIF